jgi:hypothetical protein
LSSPRPKKGKSFATRQIAFRRTLTTAMTSHIDPGPRFDYLWSLSVPRWNSAIGLGVTVLFGSFVGLLLANAGPVLKATLTAALFWTVTGFSVFAFQAFGRWILRPPLALAATKDGLITFWHQERMNYAPPGRLIPWQAIQSLSYKSYVTGRMTRAHSLVIQCNKDGNDMYLDVWSEKTGRETLTRLLELHRRFCSS